MVTRIQGKLNTYRQGIVNFVFHQLDTDGNGVIEENEIAEFLHHSHMPGILSGISSTKRNKSQDLMSRICCCDTFHKGIHLIDLEEFYIDRGMLTVDDVMFKYEVLDDWLFSEELCDMYLRNESCAPNAAHESPARNRGASMSRAASSPYLDGRRNFSINFSRSGSYHNRMLPCLSKDFSINTVEQSSALPIRPNDHRRFVDPSSRAKLGGHRSLSGDSSLFLSDRIEEWNITDNDDVAGSSHYEHLHADSKVPLRVTTTQQQRTLQVQGALLQNLMGTLDTNFARLLSEEKGSSRVEWSLTNEANRMCEIYIEKNRSIESSSPMLLSTLNSWDCVDLKSKQEQEQSIVILRMIQLMQQQQDDIKQMVEEQLNRQDSHYSHSDYRTEHPRGSIPSNHVRLVPSRSPLVSMTPMAPSKARNSYVRTDILPDNSLPSELSETNEISHKKSEELRMSMKDLKIREQSCLIKKLETDLESKQYIINMQDVLIRSQQSLLLKMQMATTK